MNPGPRSALRTLSVVIRRACRARRHAIASVLFASTLAGVSVSAAGLELARLDGIIGFVLNGVTFGDQSGFSVSGADVNGDGVVDLIIGAPAADSNGLESGATHVVFGGAGIGASGAIELSDLDGSNGFVLKGVTPGDISGLSVSSAGDVNGDGVEDLIVGAPKADPNDLDSGASYVVFGGAGVGASGAIELSDLDGSNGFVLHGVAERDEAGESVSAAGDVNADGIDDILIGAYKADPNEGRSGATYIVFGGVGVGSSGVIELAGLDGTNGFVLNGVTVNDHSGASVSRAGDVNGDGIDDILIGAFFADPNGGAGSSYVVFGGVGLGNTGVMELADLDGSNGFVVNGVDGGDRTGHAVSGAGDVNGDGIDDVLIGAYRADPDGPHSGAAYLVFGGIGVGNSGVIELSELDGSGGFAMHGVALGDGAGRSVSGAGDVNGDGIDDMLIGARDVDKNGFGSGASYLVYGGAGLGTGGVIELSGLDGISGFVSNGVDRLDFAGESVSGPGDINGDGIDDLLIGASGASPTVAGAAYVIFGVTCDLDSSGTFGREDFVEYVRQCRADPSGRLCDANGDDAFGREDALEFRRRCSAWWGPLAWSLADQHLDMISSQIP